MVVVVDDDEEEGEAEEELVPAAEYTSIELTAARAATSVKYLIMLRHRCCRKPR